MRTLTSYIMAVVYFAVAGLAIWAIVTAPSETPSQIQARQAQQAREQREKQTERQTERRLCLQARACNKYSEALLECATAGSLKTCLRIKMGEDAGYIDTCSGGDPGSPALPLPPNTPNAAECFFQRMVR